MSTPSMWKFRASLVAAFIAVAPFSPALQAQNARTIAEVNVPFAFETGGKHFSAGLYSLQVDSHRMILIRGKSESGFAMAWVDETRQTAKHGEAVFHKYGDRYFLSEISTADTKEYVCLQKSKDERQEQLAGNGTAPTGVYLALLQTPR